jgi:hypothetical protein
VKRDGLEAESSGVASTPEREIAAVIYIPDARGEVHAQTHSALVS